MQKLPELPALTVREFIELTAAIGQHNSDTGLRMLCLLREVGTARASDITNVLEKATYGNVTLTAMKLRGRGVIEVTSVSTHERGYQIAGAYVKALSWLLAPVLGDPEIAADLARYRELEKAGKLALQNPYRGGRKGKK